ncbi:MAG: glycosyltransferase [Clostridium sp.]|uniref:glycosyltransferase n=1 Tax=Clostridium sp. TaxID=1506 RepID=UPI003045794F
MIKEKEKNFISTVIYVHNSEAIVGHFLKSLYNVLNDNFKNFEIICVNDSSTDNSVNVIKDLSKDLPNSILTIVNMGYYQGIELSMIAGVDLSIGDLVFEFDGLVMDYDINTIMAVYNKALSGYDIVSASPKNTTKLASKIFYRLFNRFYNSASILKTETFRIISRRAINRVSSLNKTIPYRKAVYSNSGLKTNSIIYENKIIENSNLKSDNNGRERETLAINSFILFTDIGYKISLFFSCLMICFTIFTGSYVVVTYFSLNKPIEGWTTTMLFLSVAFLGLFLIMTIIIKYLSIILDLSFRRQKYIIQSIDKITK